MEIIPYDATLGAFVTDVNLGKDLDDATFASIETVWHELWSHAISRVFEILI